MLFNLGPEPSRTGNIYLMSEPVHLSGFELQPVLELEPGTFATQDRVLVCGCIEFFRSVTGTISACDFR